MENRPSFGWKVFLSLSLATAATFAAAPTQETALPDAPPIPEIESLHLVPSTLKLHDAADARRVLILGKAKNGALYDLSAKAQLQGGDQLSIDPQRFISGKTPGETSLTITYGDHKTQLPVQIESATVPEIGFVRDVAPVMSKAGCNAGTCHGSAKGKNGFKLSLRGYDPEFDYQALVNDVSGRRFNRVDVDQSLMLQKPTAEVPHEGGQVLKPGSREHRLFREWLNQGAKYEEPAKNRAVRIEVLPSEINLDLPGRTQELIVLAHYPDGQVREVTRDADLTSNKGEVAQLQGWTVTAVRRGEAAILVRYEGSYATGQITIMGDRSGYEWVQTPAYNYIDQHLHAKLQKLKILPSDLSTDAEFIRRVSLDLTGVPPDADRLRKFLADSSPTREKRERLIDELLASKDYIEFWANKWADLLQCSSENLGPKSVWQYRDWIRDAVASNKPYDQFVRDILLASGSSYQNPAANYYRVLREPGRIAEDVSQTFLGVRFNCNKCHDHPFERWTQNQYYEMSAYFARVSFKRGNVGTRTIKDEGTSTQRIHAEEVVYLNSGGGEVEYPRNGQQVKAHVPFGSVSETTNDNDRREAFVSWLTSPENPLFAKSMANRVWSYFFGLGIIDPVDDIRASNPPSNPELLDALTKEFVESKFDLKKLMRRICTSRAYQLSYVPNKWNSDDKVNFSHAQPRRLSAEQLYDSVSKVTGARPTLPNLPRGIRAAEIPDGKVPGEDFLTLFGRPKRQSACECERSSSLTLSHAMNLINGSMIGEAVSAPDNRLKAMVDSEPDDAKLAENIYLTILSRPPTAEELKLADFKSGGSRLEVAQDLAWALLNSPAFLFNR